MKATHAYLTLCVVGTLVPLVPVLPFFAEHGLDMPRFVNEMFANRISRFFALDVMVSALVLWTLVAIEGRRIGMRHRWAPVVASLVVGVSLGLPLFLYLRERALERRA
jgi:hypothetical protein